MKILAITNEIPFPARSGGPLRTYNVLRQIAGQHEVYVVAFASTAEQREGEAQLRGFCREVVATPARRIRESLRWQSVLDAFRHGEPLELSLAFSVELARQVGWLAERVQPDLVLLEHGSMGLYLRALPPPLRRRTAWVLHDIDFDKFARMARLQGPGAAKLRARLHAAAMRRWQPRLAAEFGCCVTMSETDRKLLLAANPRLDIKVSPNGVDTARLQPVPEAVGPELLFVGNMAYPPNVDAAVSFCAKVLPGIRARIPATRLWIVGKDPAPAVQRLAGNGVLVTGTVSDVTRYYEGAQVCVVPLRAGSGTRLKILEAMALGRPVVSTPLGCEGLEVTDGKELLIARNSQEFADRVVALLSDPARRAEIAVRARSFAVAFYDWAGIAQRLMDDLAELAAGSAQPPGEPAQNLRPAHA